MEGRRREQNSDDKEELIFREDLSVSPEELCIRAAGALHGAGIFSIGNPARRLIAVGHLRPALPAVEEISDSDSDSEEQSRQYHNTL